MRSLARRILDLNNEIADLDELIEPLVLELGADLLARPCIGVRPPGNSSSPPATTPTGCAPRPRGRCSAESPRSRRRRARPTDTVSVRGGDRQANRALHMIAISRLRTDADTKAFAARKSAEGKSKLETIRCIKRYLARETYPLLKGRIRSLSRPVRQFLMRI
jgi:transposase